MGSGARPVRSAVSRLPRRCGILNLSQPYRPPRPVTGMASLLLIVCLACVPLRIRKQWPPTLISNLQRFVRPDRSKSKGAPITGRGGL
jgi:hypothetical protein